jgi:hypothetical protein
LIAVILSLRKVVNYKRLQYEGEGIKEFVMSLLKRWGYQKLYKNWESFMDDPLRTTPKTIK